jgi:hypothetical protein
VRGSDNHHDSNLAHDGAVRAVRDPAELDELLERASRGEYVGIDLAAAQLASTPAIEFDAQDIAVRQLSDHERSVLSVPDARVMGKAIEQDPQRLETLHGETRAYAEKVLAARRKYRQRLALARRQLRRPPIRCSWARTVRPVRVHRRERRPRARRTSRSNRGSPARLSAGDGDPPHLADLALRARVGGAALAETDAQALPAGVLTAVVRRIAADLPGRGAGSRLKTAVDLAGARA